MSMIKICFVGIALVLAMSVSAFAAGDPDKPKVKMVKIKGPVTELIIDIFPSRAVKCIFPWVLDAKTNVTPARSVISDKSVFVQDRGDKQNAIEYEINGKAYDYEGAVADAFVSIEGFHFVFTLRVNHSKRAHYSIILFELDDAQKYELLADAIKKHRMEQNSTAGKKEIDIDDLAKKQSLKVIARTVLSKPEKSNVYEKNALKSDDGSRIIFSADRILSYPDIHILKIGVKNDSGLDAIYINGIQVEKTSGNTQPMSAQYEIVPRVDPGKSVKGYVVTQDKRIVDREDTRMKLLTNKGEVVLEW